MLFSSKCLSVHNSQWGISYFFSNYTDSVLMFTPHTLKEWPKCSALFMKIHPCSSHLLERFIYSKVIKQIKADASHNTGWKHGSDRFISGKMSKQVCVMLLCVCVFESVYVCAENKAQEPSSVSKVHWFFLQPASSPFDISQTLYSPEPIYRMMKARVALWPLNPVWCVSQPIIRCDCSILGYCYIQIYPYLSSALPKSPLVCILIFVTVPLILCI